MSNLVQAISNLAPGAKYIIVGEEVFENIQWIDSDPGLSKEDVEAEVAVLDEYDNKNEYQRLRAKAYPSFADQFDLLYHGGINAWKAAIDEVKQQYPKPTQE